MANGKKRLWWFTFGVGHPLASMVQGIMASSEDKAREIMFRFYGNKWCGCYGGTDIRDKVYIGRYEYSPISKILDEEDICC